MTQRRSPNSYQEKTNLSTLMSALFSFYSSLQTIMRKCSRKYPVSISPYFSDILAFASFDLRDQIRESTITKDELRYVFEVCYQLLSRVTDLDLISDPQVRGDNQDDDMYYGCKSEKETLKMMFGKSNPSEQAELPTVISKLANEREIMQFVQIFQQGKQGSGVMSFMDNFSFDDRDHFSSFNDRPSNPKTIPKDNKQVNFAPGTKGKVLEIDQDQTSFNDIKSPQSIIQRQGTAGVDHLQSKSDGSVDKHLKIEGGSEIPVPSINKSSIRVVSRKLDDEEEEEQANRTDENQWSWQMGSQKSPFSMLKMSKRVLEIRNQNDQLTSWQNFGTNLNKLQNNLQIILNKNLDTYASRQLLSFMLTLFTKREIDEMIPGQGIKSLVGVFGDKTNPDLLMPLLKRYLRNYFEILTRKDYSLARYENAKAGAEMMQILVDRRRGEKRILEQKKFKKLGQMQTLKSIYNQFIISNLDPDLLQGDQLYQNIYFSMQAMYSTKIDQLFLINFIQLKNQKRESKRLISFLEGALLQLNSVANTEVFQLSNNPYGLPSYFQETRNNIEDRLNQLKNQTHLQLIKQYSKMKIQLINYFTNLGKLKAYFKVLNYSKQSSEGVSKYLLDQIKISRLKLEDTDSKIVDLVRSHLMKQEINKKYFQTLGQLAVIKCGVKGLEFNHIFDYFALNVIEMRTQESMWLVFDIKNDHDIKQMDDQSGPVKTNKGGETLLCSKLTGSEIANLQKLQRFKYIDKHFNVGSNQSVDSINFDKFHDESAQIAQKAQKISTKFSNFSTLDFSEKSRMASYSQPEFIHQIARDIIQRLYKDIGQSENFKNIAAFHDSGQVKKSLYSLDYSHVQKNNQTNYQKLLKDIDKLEHFIFDFVPFLQKGEKLDSHNDPDAFDKELIDQIGEISTSFKNIYSDESRKLNYKELKAAYKNTAEYFEGIARFEEQDYEDQFKKRRDGVFTGAMQSLFSINKKGFLNGFNMQYLSMPIEHSHMHNYWAYQILRLYLEEAVKYQITSDISQIVNKNEISLNMNQSTFMSAFEQLSQSQTNNNDAQLINISANLGSSKGGSSNFNKRVVGVRFSQNYTELFQLLMNSENSERKTKQQLFKRLIAQMEQQMMVLGYQVTLYQETMNKMQETQDSHKIRVFLEQKLERFLNESIMTEQFDYYFQAFIDLNKVQNYKSLESIIQGANKYCQTLRDLLIKEAQDTDTTQKVRQQTEFLAKIQKDISSVMNGIRGRGQTLQNDILKERAEGAKIKESKQGSSNLKKSVGSSQQRSQSPPKPITKIKVDPFEQEVQYTEQTLLEQITSMFAIREILIGFRQSGDTRKFQNYVLQKLTLANKQKERIEIFKKYMVSVSGLADNKENKLDVQIAAKKMGVGARILNAVLSGNIFKQFDVYQTNPQNPHMFTSQTQQSELNLDLDSRQDSVYQGEGSKVSLGEVQPSQSQQQRGLNYFINFLQEICQQEDKLSSDRIIKDNQLFHYSWTVWVRFSQINQRNFQLLNMQKALDLLLNIYEIKNTPLSKYLNTYDIHANFVKKDLFKLITQTNMDLVAAQFLDSISQKGSSIVKSVINKIDEIFSQALLIDEEKTDFSNSQTKIRRALDQDLRSFREYLDQESNKKMSEFFDSGRKQHEMRAAQSVTAMQLLVRIYYLKQIQQQEDFSYNLIKQQESLEVQNQQAESMHQHIEQVGKQLKSD